MKFSSRVILANREKSYQNYQVIARGNCPILDEVFVGALFISTAVST